MLCAVAEGRCAPMAKKKKPTKPGAGYEGRFQLGEKKIIDQINPGKLTPVTINVRESALAHMASRGRLDSAQAAAGERLRKLYEQAAIGAAKSVNLEGRSGGGGEGITDTAVRASRELNRALAAVGQVGAAFLVAIVGEGRLIEDVAKSWSRAGGIVSGRRAEGFVVGRLLEAIDELVGHWRLIGRGEANLAPASFRRGGSIAYGIEGIEVTVNDDIVGSGPISCTGPAFEVHVGKFGDVEREAKRPPGTLPQQASGNLGHRGRPNKRGR